MARLAGMGKIIRSGFLFGVVFLCCASLLVLEATGLSVYGERLNYFSPEIIHLSITKLKTSSGIPVVFVCIPVFHFHPACQSQLTLNSPTVRVYRAITPADRIQCSASGTFLIILSWNCDILPESRNSSS
ncbi:hypothetical protein J6590_067358 [Homalodisca vitripennis]|nr:hypothetical protein J6590_067358 [Homalodisca vitripennis]